MARPAKKKEQTILEKFKDSESSASIVFGAIVVIVAGLLIFNFVSGNRQASVSQEGESTVSAALQGTGSPAGIYTVAEGDNLWKIAEKQYGSGYNWVDIAKANMLTSASKLMVGQVLHLPTVSPKSVTNPQPASAVIQPTIITSASPISGDSYQVQKGDNLWQIALRAYGDGYKWTSIYQANKKLITNPGVLFVGWELTLPR